MIRSFLLVGLGGAAGSMFRYAVSLLAGKWLTTQLFWGTLLVNLAGCLLIGLLLGLSQRNAAFQGETWLVLATGFCGGFTTFSAFALEGVRMIDRQQSFLAISYAVISILLGLILCRLGVWLAS